MVGLSVVPTPVEAFEKTRVPPLMEEVTRNFGQVRDSAAVATKGEVILDHSPKTALVPF